LPNFGGLVPVPYRNAICALAILFVLAGVSHCDGGTPAEAVADAVKNQADVKAFGRLFTDADHFITHYTGTKGPRYWNSKAVLHERYVLTMQFKIDLDASGVRVTATSPPKYYLHEVTSVTVTPSGQVSGISYGSTVEFGPAEWKKLEAAKGDLSAIGIKAKTDQPVSYLKAYWRDA
jgi:hypothetical protein